LSMPSRALSAASLVRVPTWRTPLRVYGRVPTVMKRRRIASSAVVAWSAKVRRSDVPGDGAVVSRENKKLVGARRSSAARAPSLAAWSTTSVGVCTNSRRSTPGKVMSEKPTLRLVGATPRIWTSM